MLNYRVFVFPSHSGDITFYTKQISAVLGDAGQVVNNEVAAGAVFNAIKFHLRVSLVVPPWGVAFGTALHWLSLLHQYPSDIMLSISLMRYGHNWVSGELIDNGGVQVAGLQLTQCRFISLKTGSEGHIAEFTVGKAKMDITLDEDRVLD